jgi:hypothetical protein
MDLDQSTLVLALAPLMLVGLALVAFVIIDIVRAERVRHLPKWAWILVSVLSVPLGAILYLLLGRDRA